MTQQRLVQLTPAHHRCHPNPATNYGIRNPYLFFILIDQGWAIHLRVNTAWGMSDEDFHTANPDCTHHMHQGSFPAGSPNGDVVGFHAPVLDYGEKGKCDWLGECYSNVNYLIADELFDLLRREGSEALWDKLQEWLDEFRTSALAALTVKGE